jgi:hypothetical protein
MSNQGLHFDAGGTAKQSPKAIQALGAARENFTRLVIAGGGLLLLIITFLLAMFFRPEFARDVLVVIGSTTGFIVGREYSQR